MKQIIGSKMAAKLAREQYGERAYVARVGKKFEVGVFSRGLCFLYGTRLVQGSGKSWEAALIDAGVLIPEPTPVERIEILS
jgi:hypothetical protein